MGLVLFTDRVEHIIPPRKGRQHILRVIRDILFYEPQGTGTDIAGALDEVNRLLKRKSIVVLISDFLQGPDGRLPNPKDKYGDSVFKALDISNRRHDLVCFELIDPRELTLPKLGVITLEDAETGEIVALNTSSEVVRKSYDFMNSSRLKDFKRSLAGSKIDLLEAYTDRPYLTTLKKFFEKRAKR